MGTGRKLVLALCKTVLIFSIGLFAFGLLFSLTLAKPDRIIGWLDGSGLYIVVTNNLKEQLRSANEDLGTPDNPIISNAVDSSLPADRIQQFVEAGITETYKWLDGETETPQFSIDVNQVKTDFANKVASGLTERAATLPACSQRLKPTSTDVFTINCIPPGTDVAEEIESIRQQILDADTDQVGGEALVSAQSLKVEKNGQQVPYYQALGNIKTYYQGLKLLTVVSITLFVIAAGIIIALTKPRYRALRTLSVPLIINGTIYTLAGFLLPNQVNALFKIDESPTSATDFGAPLKNLVSSITSYSSNILLKIGIGFFVLGIASLVAYIIIKKRNPEVAEVKAEHKQEATPPPDHSAQG